MAKSNKPDSGVKKIEIRMYRIGTGDFFLLLFRKGDKITFKMMIDCGCISADQEDFKDAMEDLTRITESNIDLLVVTHEHSDHINGFEICAGQFKDFTFKNVWFAWTESDKDKVANDYREHYSKLGFALNKAVTKLTGLVNNRYYNKLYAKEFGGDFMLKGKHHFIQSLASINELNPLRGLAAGEPLPTMVKLLKDYHVIKKDITHVECLMPGTVMSGLPGAEGIRFYVLGPPRKRESLNRTEAEGETYEKRESRSTIDFSLLSALGDTDESGKLTNLPFEPDFEATKDDREIKEEYNRKQDKWRKIDHDWLYSAGSMAMRYERSINNTSLALAIQFEDSEKVLLFTGDAEFGNWESWYKDMEWPVNIGGKIVQRKIDYFLKNTVFYKVGHHLSQNGTPKGIGIDMMKDTDLSCMVSLNFKKILAAWRNTMPNDLLGAELIRKTKGRFFLAGDRGRILKNIKTGRVTVSKEDEDNLIALNEKFDGKVYIDCTVQGQ